ncbi:MafI family immunity protein [Actinomadura sp. HBU206391]|uniref:MafI family immunity protein n=1 Tax=Actinomadura sp. HBU206391 TaxID=2731692 RepID=UPI00164F4A04|nr:MafI family immunity protein [Actinomadura sp. HBU206391]MBC6463511.1 MafI family immunity protein [Actinomadura sp. HBU206391]
MLLDFRQAQADILALLNESSITASDVRTDIKELVYVGEIGLAFDTLCSWLYEDSLAISRPFYERLLALSVDLEEPRAVERLEELVVEANPDP